MRDISEVFKYIVNRRPRIQIGSQVLRQPTLNMRNVRSVGINESKSFGGPIRGLFLPVTKQD